jgi:hypothetical protein
MAIGTGAIEIAVALTAACRTAVAQPVDEKKDGRVGVQLTDKVEAMVIRLALISFATSRRSPALPAPPLSW